MIQTLMPARPGYYAETAEQLLLKADGHTFGSPSHDSRIARAQVYATLELASAQHRLAASAERPEDGPR